MDAARLYQLMYDSSLLTEETLFQLKQLIYDYPFFTTARMLYLKNLAVLNDINFSTELKKMAVYVTDRRKLFTYIEGAGYRLKFETKKEQQETKDNAFSLIDSFLQTHSASGEMADPTLLFRPSATSDYLYWSVSSETPGQKENNSSPKLQHQELIDSFIKEDEKRTPGSGFRFEDEEDEENIPFVNFEEKQDSKQEETKTTDDDSYFTETLARIYVKQKRYDKALQIIKNLSLKYPEKNVYFADQIRFLEKLIINTKK